MAMRSIDTRFWKDGFVRKLNPLDRYLFVYLLTNDHSTWCGIYELPLDIMSFESGIEEKELMKSMLPRLHPKVIYLEGWVYIPNWVKYHLSESGNMSPQQKKGYENALNEVPEEIRLKIKDVEANGIPYAYPMGGVSASTIASTTAIASTIASTSTSIERVKRDKFGEFSNVKLSNEEYEKLVEKLSQPVVESLIVELDEYIEMKGDKYKSHRATIQAWARKKINDHHQKKLSKGKRIVGL